MDGGSRQKIRARATGSCEPRQRPCPVLVRARHLPDPGPAQVLPGHEPGLPGSYQSRAFPMPGPCGLPTRPDPIDTPTSERGVGRYACDHQGGTLSGRFCCMGI